MESKAAIGASAYSAQDESLIKQVWWRIMPLLSLIHI